MSLFKEQLEELNRICSLLSMDQLVELKKGNISGIRDYQTKKLDPELIIQHTEMKDVIKKWINRKNREKNKPNIG